LSNFLQDIGEDNMRTAKQWKHVFCLEGLWDNDLRGASSVQPILELIRRFYNSHFKYIYKDCATAIELEYYLKRWANGYKDYTILYLAFHGEQQHIKLATEGYSLDQLGLTLEGKCTNRIVVLGSCSTMDIDKRIINRFIKQTNCLAVCGYRTDVDWMKSTAFELLMLDAMQDNEFSGRGIEAIEKRLSDIASAYKELHFRMVTLKEI